MRISPKVTLPALAVLAAGALMLSGCQQSTPEPTGDGPATGEPIKVVSISTISGPVSYPDPGDSAAAYFKAYNEAGGVNGRPIEFSVVDDKADPATGSAAARDAVDSGAVAIVSGVSVLDCAVNGAYYQQAGIANIPGGAADQTCFTSPNIGPQNAGPYKAARLTLDLADDLGLESICGIVGVAGAQQQEYDKTFAGWTEDTGHEFTVLDYIPYSAPDFTPYIIKAKEAGCDTIFFNGPTVLSIAIMSAGEAQGVDFTYLFSTPSYTEDFAAAAPDTGNGVYLVAEFAPFTDTDPGAGAAEWAAVQKDAGLPLTALGEGGYLSAKLLTQVLEGIDGEITKDTVLAALQAQTEGIEDPLIGSPWIFGSDETHNPNDSGWALLLKPGATTWENVSEDWLHTGE